MHEILRHLPRGARVLDLGSGRGSFGSDWYPGVRAVRLDIALPGPERVAGFVRGAAARLPFRAGSFDAVIANHSLEHVEDLDLALKEIGRIVRPDGSLYVAVPDASTLSDRIYRWMYHGGGHINPFQSAARLSSEIARATGLQPVAMRVLHTSFEFASRHHFGPRPPRRFRILGNGNPKFIAVLTYVLRILDRLFGARSSVYGWAFYFGDIREAVETSAWTNVCAGCGTGQSEASLVVNNRVRRQFVFLRSYICPICGAWNLFTKDHLARDSQQVRDPGDLVRGG